MENKNRILQLLLSYIFISFLFGCSQVDNQNESKRTTTQVPTQLQKLATNGGVLSAYVVIDENNTRIPLDINPEGNGSASVVLPGLSRTVHSIEITYEYTADATGDIIVLAKVVRVVDLSSGSVNLNIDSNNYNLAFDDDEDGVINATELLEGSNPRISDVDNVASLGIDVATPSLSALAQEEGNLFAFVTLDGNGNRISMEIDETGFANIVIRNLSKTPHDFLVEIEYFDANGVFTVATLNSFIDLSLRSARLSFSLNELEQQFDDDGDGISNAEELAQGSDPRLVTKPFIGAAVSLSYESIKTFTFRWLDVNDATYYRVLENIDGRSGFNQIGTDIDSGVQVFEHYVPLYSRLNAQYLLQSCNDLDCTDGESVFVSGSLVGSIGYVKPNADMRLFGTSLSLSEDGNTLVITNDTPPRIDTFNQSDGGWEQQDSIALSSTPRAVSLSGDGNTLAINVAFNAVNIYVRNGISWLFQSSLNEGKGVSSFGISDDGNVIAIGWSGESSNSTGINGDENNSLAAFSGAAYVYRRVGTVWSREAYIKASNAEASDEFGGLVRLSGDASSLAVSATREDSAGSGISSQLQANNEMTDSGAVYVFNFDLSNGWEQQEYIKSNTPAVRDLFGSRLSVNKDATILATSSEDASSSVTSHGAVFIFERNNLDVWSQQFIIRESVLNNGLNNGGFFGRAISLNSLGDVIAIGDSGNGSELVGLNGNDDSRRDTGAGAAYIYAKQDNIWIKRAFVKATNTDASDGFGSDVSLSGDGDTFAVSAPQEASESTGINSDPFNNLLNSAGAVYLY